MLKWRNPTLKSSTLDCESVYAQRKQTPYISKRQRRCTTICEFNKENLPPPISASPVVMSDFEQTSSRASKTPEAVRTPVSVKRTSKYASTLPRFEEEYSPNTFLPVGQELALRGLFPDIFTGKQRYFSSPQLAKQVKELIDQKTPRHVGPKRKLEAELLENVTPKTVQGSANISGTSTTMHDRTLDKLINAILESACKTQKKKKPLKALNLRRKTLLRSQQDYMKDVSLSPSYAAGDDPASDLSFLLVEPSTARRIPASGKNLQDLPPTPLPHTPGLRNSITKEALLNMPTPVRSPSRLTPIVSNDDSTSTFKLETPVRKVRKRKSQADCHDHGLELNTPKRYKQDNKNAYLDVGLALPSIYI